ncbi:RagB/SusD family nutrient uptake outer membrane protein [Chryseobacterium bernardetii]|uniref:RagB/SusD family nutrient uptake outer membrane protein n=1 Tax=Chryseobacterium bernardetii TaxID=1241978 RepID=UPI0030161A06
MKKIFIKVFFSALTLSVITACNDEGLDPNLSQAKDLETSINSAADLRTVLAGGYDRMTAVSYYGRDLIIFGEVRTDNCFSNANSNRFVSVGQMSMLPSDAYASDTWSKIYQAIANANIVINKPAAQLTGDTGEINHIKGQALIMRALGHFDLVRVFGQQFVDGQGGMNALGVPYVKTFRDANNLFPSRNSVQEDYDNIINDLDTAISLMNATYDDASKHYLTSLAAHAIKARVALYFKKYQLAESEAKIVVDSGKYTIATAANYASTFKVDSVSNIIFALDFNANDNLGNNSLASIYRGSAYGDIVALKDLYDAYQTGDIRKTSAFIAPNGSSTLEYRNIGKYPTVATPADDVPVVRIEEVVLIYAEALLNNGKAADALIQLNKIPANRNASPYAAATMDNILLERRKELAFEGFRFDDLARTGKSIPVVDPVRQKFGTVNFGSFKYAFPIPQTEVGANGNLKQNNGY